MLILPQLKRFECFIAVAEELHFRRAAERVGLTQPALSQQIKELETELGVALFDRDRRSVALTKAGDAFLPGCKAAIAKLYEAAAAARELSDASQTTLRFGYLGYLNVPLIHETFKRLKEQDAAIRIEPQELSPAAVVDALARREIDLGVTFLPVDHPDLAHRVILEGGWMIAMPSTHRLAEKAELQATDLSGEPLIMFARHLNPALHDRLLAQFEAANAAPNVVYSVTQATSGPRFVSEGMGLFIFASYVLSDLPAGVVSRPIAGFPVMRMAAVWRGDRRTRAVRAFLDALAEASRTGGALPSS